MSQRERSRRNYLRDRNGQGAEEPGSIGAVNGILHYDDPGSLFGYSWDIKRLTRTFIPTGKK